MVREISLREIRSTEQEADFLKAIERFECQDKDVENYLKTKAFEMDRRNKSRTYLITKSENLEIIILGYYTLTLKNLPFNETVSKGMIQKIDGYSRNINSAESVLIGQLGKNYNYRAEISGSDLMKYAIDTVYDIHNLVGGRIAFLECADNPKIVDFYTANGFVFLQASPGGEFLQMIRHL